MGKITVRYFTVEKNHGNAPDFEAALNNVFSKGAKASEREKTIMEKTFRLERLVQDETFFDGEIVRKQTTDIPPEANEAGLQKLSVSEGGGIGHCIAFRYSTTLRVIAIQFDNRAVSINRLLAYILDYDPNYDYSAKSIVDENAWLQYNRGVPKKLEIEIAQPQNLSAVEGDVGSLIESTKRLSELSDAPIISVQLKMGRKDGSLSKKVIDQIIQHFGSGDIDLDVKKLRATSKNEDGSEEINFLNFYLKVSDKLELPQENPEENYEKRRRFIKSHYSGVFAYIQETYGG